MPLYVSSEIQKLTGLTRLQVVRFVDLGIVVPYREHEGKGGRRYFNQQNLCEFLVCRELYKHRVSTSTMRAVNLWLRGELWKDQKGSYWADYRKGRIPKGLFFVLSESAHTTNYEEPLIYKLLSLKPLPGVLEGTPAKHFKLIGLFNKEELGKVLELCDSAIAINLDRIIKEAGGLTRA